MKKSKPTATSHTVVGGSFRDPAGFMYRNAEGALLRQVNQAGAEDFDLSVSSGLLETLIQQKLLINHTSLPPSRGAAAGAHAVLQPEVVPYITYPFEWSFSQLKDTALLTLKLQQQAMKHGMALKDASAYNVQWLQGKPIFIDTLSFEAYKPGKPWQAYRQFCQHFLAPLALMAHTDTRLSQLMRVHLDGIPLDLAARLLPRQAKLKPGLAMHLVLHARAQKAKASEHQRPQKELKQSGLEAILDSLERTIGRLQPPKAHTEWGDYYDHTNYTADAADHKAKLITAFAKPLKARTALDMGGNNGRFSRTLNGLGIDTLCADIDPNAVEANYRFVQKHGETAMLPLLVDTTNPGGALGWHNTEREPVHERLQTDLMMALALVHHLAIGNNLPLEKIANYFAAFAPHLIIEFVPKEDSQVQKLLSTRADIFPNYTKEGFETAFSSYFELVKQKPIPQTKRTLYLYKRKSA